MRKLIHDGDANGVSAGDASSLACGTTLVSAQPPAPVAAVMTTESFDAPEGMYVCTSRFTSPPQPMIHLNPVPTTQLGLSAIYPTPRVSTVSLRYPASSKKASDTNDFASAAARGVLLEAPLASQGIDAPSSSLTVDCHQAAQALRQASPASVVPGWVSLVSARPWANSAPNPPDQEQPQKHLEQLCQSYDDQPDLAKILSARTDTEHFTFLTNARSFFWLADTNGRTKESLARITFGASPSAHDVNQFTRAHDRLDIVIGFVTGDLVWFDPIAGKYTRINKGGCIPPRR